MAFRISQPAKTFSKLASMQNNASQPLEEVGTGLPCGGPVLFENGFYYVRCLLTQRVRDSDVLWNYAVINSQTQVAEAYVAALPGAAIAANTLAAKLKELYEEEAAQSEREGRSLN